MPPLPRRAQCTVGLGSRGTDLGFPPHPRGVFVEGGTAAVEAQSFVDPSQSDYLVSSEPYRPHVQTELPMPPPRVAYGEESYPPLSESGFSDSDTLDVGDNFDSEGTSPLALDREARSLLLRYMGDLYRDTDSGEPTDGAGSGVAEWRSAYGFGLPTDASRPNPGIALPPEFAMNYRHLDELSSLNPTPARTGRAFLFSGEDQQRFFEVPQIAPETRAYAESLRVPASTAKRSPLESRDYRKDITPWLFILKASSLAERLAIYSAALADLLLRADELEVVEEDRVAIQNVILSLSTMQFAQAARMRLLAIGEYRNHTLGALGLDRSCTSAANRIPRDGQFLFAGKLLDSIDTDNAMFKRAKEVADRTAKARVGRPDTRRRTRFFSTSYPSRGRNQSFRARGRGDSRAARGRGGAAGRGSSAKPSTYIPQRK